MQISVMSFDAEKLDVNPASRNVCSITAYSADGAAVLSNFNAEQVVNHFGVDDLLDEIG